MSEDHGNRREFLKAIGLAGAVFATGGLAFAYRRYVRGVYTRTAPDTLYSDAMPTRRLGKTGFEVSLLGLGGQAALQWNERLPLNKPGAIIRGALDLGVNYIDTSPSYGDSELRIGATLGDRRKNVFLATKTHDRTYDGTLRLFEQSLERLRTDYVDLYQIHNVRVHEDLDRAFARDGALRAMRRLQDEGAVKHIGITGHRDPDVLLRGIREEQFDTILMALNAGDVHLNPFQATLLQEAVSQDLGIIAMKVTAMRRLFRDDGISSMNDALGYVYSLPVSTAVIGISEVRELEENARIAKGFTAPFPPERMAALEESTKHYSEDANWYKIQWY